MPQFMHQGKANTGFPSFVIIIDIPDRAFHKPIAVFNQCVPDPRTESILTHHLRIYIRSFSLWIRSELRVRHKFNLLSESGQQSMHIKRERGSPHIPQQFSGFLDCLFSFKGTIKHVHRDIHPLCHPGHRSRCS